jgi:hypothetical protein
MRTLLTILVGISSLTYFFIQGNRFIESNSQTFDEAVHLTAGYSYLKRGDFRLNIEDPPLPKLLWALPILLIHDLPFEPPQDLWEQADEWLIGKDFLYESSVPFQKLLSMGRWVNLILGGILIVAIGWWSFRLWGYLGSKISMVVASFDPNLLALSCILSSDVSLTLFTTTTFYLLWEYVQKPTSWKIILLGISLGFALGSKFSSIFVVATLFASIGLFLIWGDFFTLPGIEVDRNQSSFKKRFQLAIPAIIRITLIAFLTLLPLYFFTQFPAWGKGLKQQFLRNAFEPPKYYFFGEVTSSGSLLYFPFAFLAKTPIGTLVLLFFSYIAVRFHRSLTRREWFFLVLPPLIFLGMMMLTKVNMGIRVILPIYPFLFVLMGRLGTTESSYELPKLGQIIPYFMILVCLGLVIKSSVRSSEHQLSYFNELVGGSRKAYAYLGDSNLDWGQDLDRLKYYVHQEKLDILYLSYAGTAPPAKYGIRYELLPSWGYLEISKDRVPEDSKRHVLAISISNLQGIYLKDPKTYHWLFETKPTTIVGNTIWIFDLTDKPFFLAQLQSLRI